VAGYLPADVGALGRLRFRDDLRYLRASDGFELVARSGRSALRGFAGASLLGDLLDRGDCTAGEIEVALARAGADALVVADVLRQLYEAGLLNEGF